MKKHIGITSIELLASLATIATMYGLTLTVTQDAKKEVENFIQIQNQQRQQICKIRPSMCEEFENASL